MLTGNVSSVANNSSNDSSDINSILNNGSFLDKQDFLKLFVEQLKHQDPLNPMENYEVASQLAQYSSLEQLVNINSNFQKFIDLSAMNSYFQGINLVGKQINYEGNKVFFDPTNPNGISIKFKLNEPTAKVNINIYDENDNFIRSLEIENPDKGDNSIHWDGKDSKGNVVNKGIYKYEVLGYNEEGEQVNYTPFGNGYVNSIRYDKENSQALIKVNNDEVEITKITDVMN